MHSFPSPYRSNIIYITASQKKGILVRVRSPLKHLCFLMLLFYHTEANFQRTVLQCVCQVLLSKEIQPLFLHPHPRHHLRCCFFSNEQPSSLISTGIYPPAITRSSAGEKNRKLPSKEHKSYNNCIIIGTNQIEKIPPTKLVVYFEKLNKQKSTYSVTLTWE